MAVVLNGCSECRKEKLPKPTTLAPSAAERPDGPFKVWAIDLAGPLPPDQDGNTYALIAVDAFSKWVEVGKLPSKHAWRTAEWILNELICRWGRPSLIRVDNGGEWLGDFREFLSRIGVPVLPITVGNSAANGQAERMIRTFKDIVRREGVIEDGYWADALPSVLAALRMTSAASHGLPPFTIITGQYPALPSHILDEPLSEKLIEPSESDQESYTAAVIAMTRKLYAEAKLRLAKRDADTQRRLLQTE